MSTLGVELSGKPKSAIPNDIVEKVHKSNMSHRLKLTAVAESIGISKEQAQNISTNILGNDPIHKAILTVKLHELKSEILPRAPCSPDIAHLTTASYPTCRNFCSDIISATNSLLRGRGDPSIASLLAIVGRGLL
ncbi:hypothetical protein TNCV_820611 [Trichonephila clavipes]|nr:hypothetical protein TNCV_820611 [Trichonephila clavipes]